ncbi:WhiB family transcriptional regulator [Streptomyces sp. NPDC006784]|uniref:WhiB family transcriptional regulator n=1 Tax=Streptomyces sp. NPDC006784 TaxID=3364764 RepID=UPI003693F748
MTREERATRARALHRAGWTDPAIAAHLGVSTRTVLRLRHEPTRTRKATVIIDRPKPSASWHRHGACTRPTPVPADWDGDGDTTESIAAQNICMLRCPVRALCLAEAMHVEGAMPTGGRNGIAGGLTPVQRASLYRTLRSRTQEVPA